MAPFAPSFRDPAGYCLIFEGRVFRFVAPSATGDFDSFLNAKFAKELVSAKSLVSTRKLDTTETASLSRRLQTSPNASIPHHIYEHERIWFPSYPYEWPPEMLCEAGKLTLRIAQAALAEGWTLKDATPYNILFRGSQPVFVDALSFEKRIEGEILWKPYAQLVRTFLLPLLANRRWGIRMADVFTTRRDGLEPEEVYRFCGKLDCFKPSIFTLVSMPTWLGRKTSDEQTVYKPRTVADHEKARFIVNSLFNRMNRTLKSLAPGSQGKSVWSDYMNEHSYSDPAFAAKERFVSEALSEFKPTRVLDVGANTGRFSALAAKSGARVVAVDLDPMCMGMLWRRAHEEKLDIQPLVVHLGRPSPALGWNNQECPSFLDRARGAFDGVFMLALIHHLLVTERVPLPEVLRTAANLTTSIAIVEFVAPQDAMFKRLTRGREDLHSNLDVSEFERECAPHFDIIRFLDLPGTQRRLYCLKRKAATG
jgi:SAM-dependent methyltransferase